MSCSLILGTGSCERHWGGLKRLKSGQSSHMTAEKIDQLAAVYTSACTERGELKAKLRIADNSNSWEDRDFDKVGCSKSLKDGIIASVTDTVTEDLVVDTWPATPLDWEVEVNYDNRIVNKVRFQQRYGGMRYYNTDEQDRDKWCVIDEASIFYVPTGANKGWNVTAWKPLSDAAKSGSETETWPIIGHDLHFMIRGKLSVGVMMLLNGFVFWSTNDKVSSFLLLISLLLSQS